MSRNLKVVFIIAAAYALSVSPVAAAALWNIDNVTFGGPDVLTGTFQYDDAYQNLIAYNVNDSLGTKSFTLNNGDGSTFTSSANGFQITSADTNFILTLAFATALSDSVPTSALLTGPSGSSPSYTKSSFGSGPLGKLYIEDDIQGGTVDQTSGAPEPGTLLLFGGTGIAALIIRRRSRR